MKRRDWLGGGAIALLLSACKALPDIRPGDSRPAVPPTSQPQPPVPIVAPPRPKPKIGLALGGGAARGFAHIGVIKALETQGLVPDIIVGTSAGAVVGSLYAHGHDVFALQKLAIELQESAFTDWAIFDRGFLKGEALERFINQNTGNRGIEQLKRRFAAVATDLASGEMAVFTQGNVGQAVRASSSIPQIFPSVTIRGREYVDGGLTSPIPVRAARQLGADLVVAVDISNHASGIAQQSGVALLLDTVAIMGATIGRYELRDADVVIRPDIAGLPASNFQQRHEAILRGEQAGFAAIPRIRERLAALVNR